MNSLDILILFLLIVQAKRWSDYGFIRGIFSVGGFWIGVFVAVIMAPAFVGIVNSPFLQLLFAVLLIILLGSTMGLLGKLIGNKLQPLVRSLKLSALNNMFGIIFSTVSTLLLVWMLASIVRSAPFTVLNRQIRSSSIIQILDNNLPPAPSFLARINSILDTNGFPRVFIGPEPFAIQPADPPTTKELNDALRVAGRSTVRLESFGCGGLKYGSGFVADTDIVITNAHVVSGIDKPIIFDENGRHTARVVLFDPDIDIAILRSSNLAGEPLALDTQLYPRGTRTVALGYPGGQNLQAVPASILQNISAEGRNIYGRSAVSRSISILQTNVISGNSGGPVVLNDGTVIGVIFARSDSLDSVGFAIRASEVRPLLSRALRQNNAVSTMTCSY